FQPQSVLRRRPVAPRYGVPGHVQEVAWCHLTQESPALASIKQIRPVPNTAFGLWRRAATSCSVHFEATRPEGLQDRTADEAGGACDQDAGTHLTHLRKPSRHTVTWSLSAMLASTTNRSVPRRNARTAVQGLSPFPHGRSPIRSRGVHSTHVSN